MNAKPCRLRAVQGGVGRALKVVGEDRDPLPPVDAPLPPVDDAALPGQFVYCASPHGHLCSPMPPVGTVSPQYCDTAVRLLNEKGDIHRSPNALPACDEPPDTYR